MLKNWFGSLLFKFCGDLLEDFPKNDIEIKKWQGVGEKKNLKLKYPKIKRVFEYLFGICVDVKEAQIGLLRFQIPWNQIWKKPSRILIKDAYICVSARSDFSEEFMRARIQRKKMNLIEKAIKKFSNCLPQESFSLMKSLKNFLSEMIVIEIENFHLKFEDEGICLKNQKFCLGMTFSLYLTPSMQNMTQSKLRKKQLDFEVKNFGMYLKIENQKVIHDQNENQILEPINLKVIISTQLPQESNEHALRQIDILFVDPVQINIDNNQFHALMRLLRLKQWHCQIGNHLIYRPNFNQRPKSHSQKWIKYLQQINESYLKDRKFQREGFKQFEQKKLQREEYINILLIEMFHQQNNMVRIQNELKKYNQQEFQELKTRMEDILLVEEIIFASRRANDIINSQELLKLKLQELNLEQNNGENKKSIFWSPWHIFWKKNQQDSEGTEFNEQYEKLKMSDDSQQILKLFDIKIKNIQLNLKSVLGSISNTFLKIQFEDIQSIIKNRCNSFNLQYSIKNIEAYDTMNPNKDYQCVFSHHAYANRSQKEQFYNKDRQLLTISYELLQFRKHSEKCHNIIVNIIPLLISLNDTVIIRLYPFLTQIRKHDYFFDLVALNQGLAYKEFLQHFIHRICEQENFNLNVHTDAITLRVPESAIKQNCPLLQFNFQSYNLSIEKEIKQQIDNFSVSFQYNQNGDKTILNLLDQCTLISILNKNIKDNKVDIMIKNTLSEILMRIPILPTDFLKNFIYNMLSTMENLKRIQIIDELDLQTHSQLQNKRKRSHSLSLQRDQSSISRRDDTSSQNGSDVFYDADEFFKFRMLQQMQSLQYTMHMSPLERREELLKKWRKLKANLSYIISGLFKDVDPYFRNFITKLKIEIFSECPKLVIQIAKQKFRQNQRSTEFKLVKIKSILSKLETQQEFGFELKLNDVHASIYKLRDIGKIIDLKKQKSHDVLTDINSDMLNLLPFILRLKELAINYKIKIGLIKVQFQDKLTSEIVYVVIEIKNLSIQSEEPFKLFYRQTLEDQPFFLEINNSQVAQWNTSLRCTFQLLVNYYNQKFNQIAQSLIEKSGFEIQFIKNLSEIQTIIQSKQLLIHITPHLIQTLYYLNRHSIKIKSLLLKEQNEKGKQQIIVKNTKFSNQFILENEDASLQVSQLELQHSTHYRAKYQIQIKETIKNQFSYKQFEQFYKKQTFNERISETSKENISERESIKQIEELQQEIKIQPIYYIFVNLTGQKLLFNINGIESKVSHQEFKYICCKEEIKFKFTPHVHYFNYSCIIQDYIQGVYFLRICSLSEKDRSIYYLLQITQHSQTKIYQIEQLPKAPYLIKNKCSQLISISQDKYPNIVVDSGFSETFCWDMPFENSILQLSMQSDGLTKKFLIDVDGFNNQEILIDKNLYDTIDKEYSLEIFNDGVQKVVVITEREALKPKLKTFKMQFDAIGISIIDQIELVYLSCNNLLFLKQVKNDKTIYILELENAQIDNQSDFLPKRQLFVQTTQSSTMKKILTNYSKYRQTPEIQQNVTPSQQVPSGTQNSQDTRYNVIDKETYYQGAAFQHQHSELSGEQGLFRIKCKQKTITEILVHLMYIRIRLPNYKLIIDGQLMHKLIEFAGNTRNLLPDNSKIGSTNKSFDRVNTSQNESFSKQVKPKLIHIDKIQVSPFTFRLKFKNLILIEQVLQTFHHLAGLAAFFLTQLKQLYFEFPAYVKSEQSKIMEGNYEEQISNVINFYGAHLSQLIHQQINASNILKNQGNLSKQINTELNKFLAEMNAENQDFSGWSFRFQLLQTGFSMCQSMFSAIDSTLETVLQGIQKYFEAQNVQNQVQQKTSFYNKLSQLFHKVSAMHKNFLPNSYNIQSFQQIIQKLKTRRLPLFRTDRISSYSEVLAKIQLFNMWKQPDLGNKFIYYQLNENIYVYLSKLIFALIDVNQNIICLEIQTQLFQSIGNNDNQCWIKYKWKSDEEEIGMKQFKIKKYTLNFMIDEELVQNITNQVKKLLETLNQTQSQIFSLMME